MFAGFEMFDFSVLIEHWLERIDLISVKLAQEVITSGIAKLQRPNKYIFREYIQIFDLGRSSLEHMDLPKEFSMTPDVAKELKNISFFLEYIQSTQEPTCLSW